MASGRQLARGGHRPDQALAAHEGARPGDPAAPAQLGDDDGDEGDDRPQPRDHQDQVATGVLAALLDEAEIVQEHQLGDRAGVADDLVRADLHRATGDLDHRSLPLCHLLRRLALERPRIVVGAQQQLPVARAQADRDEAFVAHRPVEQRLQAHALGILDGVRDRVRERVGEQLAAGHQVARKPAQREAIDQRQRQVRRDAERQQQGNQEAQLEAEGVHSQTARARALPAEVIERSYRCSSRKPDERPRSRQGVARSLRRARRQHHAAASATPLAAQKTELKPRVSLIAPPSTPPITPDAP